MTGARLLMLGGGGGAPLTAGESPDPISSLVTNPHSALVNSPTATVTPAGGYPPYRCAWSYVSGATGIACNTPSALATYWSLTCNWTVNKSATWRWTVTDALGQQTTGTVTVEYTGTA